MIARPGHARHGADDRLQLEVHLRQRLVHVLDVLSRIGQEHGALPEVTAQPADLVRGPKRTGQQAQRCGGAASPGSHARHLWAGP